MKAFAAASIGPVLCTAADPASVMPDAADAREFPIPPAIAAPSFINAPPIPVMIPPTNVTALKAMNAPTTFGSMEISLAIVSACCSIKPASATSASDTAWQTSPKLFRLVSDPKPPFSFPSAAPTAEKASPKAAPTFLADTMNTLKYFFAFSTKMPNFPFWRLVLIPVTISVAD